MIYLIFKQYALGLDVEMITVADRCLYDCLSGTHTTNTPYWKLWL